MKNPTQDAHDASGDSTWSAWRRRIAWLVFACGIAMYGAGTYMHHATGEDWLSALGFPLNAHFFQILGAFGVPATATVLMMQTVRKLPPSRERTILKWIGWSLLVFLFVWWSPLHIALFGPS